MLRTCKGLSLFTESLNSYLMFKILDNVAVLCLILSFTDLWPKPKLLLDRLSSPDHKVYSHWFLQAALPHVILPFSELSDRFPWMCYLVVYFSPHLIEDSWGDGSLAISFVFPTLPQWWGALSSEKALRWLWNMSIKFPQYKTLTLAPIMLPLWRLNRESERFRIADASKAGCLVPCSPK